MIRPRGLHLATIARLLPQSLTRVQVKGKRLFIAIADHYEPMWNDPPAHIQLERVKRWVEGFPKMADQFTDSRGQRPQHTFFYPAEVYTPEHLDELSQLCKAGYGEVEVHLHHDNDNENNLRETLTEFKQTLYQKHGLLRTNESGEITYGFIHGNWALNNSRPDGRWCGVNNETNILRETGCYADFTMPSAPSNTQTRTFNQIYYAFDCADAPKSHDSGQRAKTGQPAPENGLLMIQGPLMLDWQRRKFGVLPGLENADLHGGFPPTANRLRQWMRAGVSVEGRPDWLFVKLHTHGAPERNADMLLGEPMYRFHQHLADLANECEDFEYYYVTTHQMASLVHQAEQGRTEPEF